MAAFYSVLLLLLTYLSGLGTALNLGNDIFTLTSAESIACDFHDLSLPDSHIRKRRSENAMARITSLNIESKVLTRFAETAIKSELRNTMDVNANAEFVVQVPEAAFITNFTMLIDGVLHVAQVKTKEEAQKDFDRARENNQTAGQVRSDRESETFSERGFDVFEVHVTLKSNSMIEFTLSYQELLERRFGMYENRISIRPNQIVEQLRAEVYIYEPQGVTEMEVLEPLITNEVVNQDTTIEDLEGDIKHIVYEPSPARQRELNSTNGILADFVIRYDVEHVDNIGIVQTEDNYFVHHFTPIENELDTLSKNVIFVIDISGSMGGRKIEQTRDAMVAILDRLEQIDSFRIVLFDDSIKQWPLEHSEMVPVNDENIEEAKNYVLENVEAAGGTDIHRGLITACDVFTNVEAAKGQNMIIFLTDGRPTAGEDNPTQIIENVVAAANEKVAIFSLGFGFDLDFDLLQGLAYSTRGFAKRIYEEGDADKQLEEFFRSISAPILYDVQINYSPSKVDDSSLTTNTFAQFFKGSEVVVAGKLLSTPQDGFEVVIRAISNDVYEIDRNVTDTQVDIPPLMQENASELYLEKLYVYMTIKDLLKKRFIATTEEEKKALEEEALALALEYNLVTPLTSMIITEAEAAVGSRENDDTDVFDKNVSHSSDAVKCVKHDIIFLILGVIIQSVLNI